MTRQDLEGIVNDALMKLSEHFEAVQILASRPHEESGGTEAFSNGRGNWYARIGMARAFVERDQASISAGEIAGAIRPPDDGDSWKS